MDKRELCAVAEEAKKNSYSPYSRIKVGAAILTKDGKVFSGCNVENSSYGLTLCAERVALAKAASEGFRHFEAIAVSSSLPGTVYPCGACLQSLCEFSPSLRVYIKNSNGKTLSTTLRKLLPNAFKLK